MKDKFYNILNSSSIKNSFLLMVGTGISQLIPVIVSPFLTRMYLPADFGDLAIFVAISMMIGMCASGMYEYAIVLPKNILSALNIIKLITLLSLLVCITIFIICYIISCFISLDYFYFFIPFSVFFTVCYNVLSYWFNRNKQYRILNILRISHSILIVVGSLFLCGIKYGLIYGYMLGGLMCFIFYMISFLPYLKRINYNELQKIAFEYQKFPMLILPTSLMNTVSGYAPVFFIKKVYSSAQLGYYSMSTRVLTAPISVISSAIGQVYFKNLSDYYNDNRDDLIKKVFSQSTYILCIMSLFIFLPLFFFGESLATLIFGKEWRETGEFIEIIALASMVKFIVSPLSMILIVKKELKKVAKWQSLYFCTTIAIFVLGSFFSIKTLLWIYVLHETILYTYYFYIMINSLKK